MRTRMQKMPYKYIAAHLKKTELACRLHYHQLSHGSRRRRRATSFSSSPSDRSPPLMSAVVSVVDDGRKSRSPPLPCISSDYDLVSGGAAVEARRILHDGESWNRFPPILARPRSDCLSHHIGGSNYSLPGIESRRALPLAPFSQGRHDADQPFRFGAASTGQRPVDLERLDSIYSAHRQHFWTAVAHEYGPDVSPYALEEAFKTGIRSNQGGGHGSWSSPQLMHGRDHKTPDDFGQGLDKTRISSLLACS